MLSSHTSDKMLRKELKKNNCETVQEVFCVNIPSYVVSDCEGVDEEVNNLEGVQHVLSFISTFWCCVAIFVKLPYFGGAIS